MIKVEDIEVWGWKHAIRGMRKAMNSEARSDSWFDPDNSERFRIGNNDMKLMHNLYVASLSNNFAHRKFMRQISVSMDITAPFYWWKQADTYKIGTVANSQSTMHKIHAKEFTRDDFSHEHLMNTSLKILDLTIEELNRWRGIYLNGGSSDEDPTGQTRRIFEPKDKEAWWQLIQLLPSTYNQTRTVTLNYEVALTMITQRTGHKLDEWKQFVAILSKLPYLEEICSGDYDVENY